MKKYRRAFIVIAVIIVGLIIWTLLLQQEKQIKILGEEAATVNAIKLMTEQMFQRKEVKFKIHFQTYGYTEMNKIANLDFGGGSGIYDIVLQYNTALSNYVRNSYIIDLDRIRELTPDLVIDKKLPFEDSLFQNDWREIGWYYDMKDSTKIKPFGIPFASNSILLAYNKELYNDPNLGSEYRARFKQNLAPPSTWGEMIQQVAFFNRPKENIYGIVMQGQPYFIYYEWANLAFSYLGGVMQKEWGWQGDLQTELILTSPQTLKATIDYLKLTKMNAPYDFLSTDQYHLPGYMKEHKIALCLLWSDVAYNLAYTNGKRDDRFGFTVIPGSVSLLAGGCFYINKNSKHVREAIDLVMRLLNENNQIEMMKNGLCSPLRSIYDHPTVMEIPYSLALKQSLDRGIYMLEAGPDADHIITIISNALQQSYRSEDEKEIEEIMLLAEKEIRKIRLEVFSYITEKK